MKEVPLTELLESVPKNARYVLEEELSATYYPVGDWCHKASDMIRKLVERLDAYEKLAEASQIASPPPKKKPIPRTDLYGLAMQSGFMLSTQYGQDDGKMMPATDGDTLVKLARAIEERHGIK